MENLARDTVIYLQIDALQKLKEILQKREESIPLPEKSIHEALLEKFPGIKVRQKKPQKKS